MAKTFALSSSRIWGHICRMSCPHGARPKQHKSKIPWLWILTHRKPLTVWHYGVKWKTLSEWIVSKTKLWRWNKWLFEIAYTIRPLWFCPCWPAENHGMQRMHIKHSWPRPLLEDKYVYTLPLSSGGNPFNLTVPLHWEAPLPDTNAVTQAILKPDEPIQP